MGYAFARRDASVAKAVRRIAIEQAGSAIATAAAPPAEDTIHTLRKHCKKLRGLLRLVRPNFPAYATENAAIRDAAHGLAGARDAEVMLGTLDMLSEEKALAGVDLTPLRSVLTARRDAEAAGDGLAERLETFSAAMQALAERAKHWKLGDTGFDALADGLEASFAKARKGLRAASADPSTEIMHEWRKHVKNHWYHSRLLTPLWPGPIGAHADATGRLGDLLGLHHDIAVLSAFVSAGPELLPEAARTALAEAAAACSLRLEGECFALGRRLLAEKPEALSHRWRAAWKSWRDERKLAA